MGKQAYNITMIVAFFMLAQMAQADTSWAEFKTDFFSYGRLVMQLPKPCKIDSTKKPDYTLYSIKSRGFKVPLNIMIAWKLPSQGFKGRSDMVLSSKQRRPIAGTNGMVSVGTYNNKPGQWFEFISHKLFGKDLHLRIWYENASQPDVQAIDSVLNSIKAVEK